MTRTPGDILRRWINCINEGDLNGALSLYNEKALLIPTFASRLLGRTEGIRDYFERLCAREELSIALHEKTVVTQPVAGPIHALSGIYCWRFAIDGEMLNFEARFSFVLDLSQPAPILHHHSSQIPRTL